MISFSKLGQKNISQVCNILRLKVRRKKQTLGLIRPSNTFEVILHFVKKLRLYNVGFRSRSREPAIKIDGSIHSFKVLR